MPLRAGLSFDGHIGHVLEAVGVDRLHLWTVAPEGDRLLWSPYVLALRPDVGLPFGHFAICSGPNVPPAR
jgi:hypothetical protein